MSNTHLAAAQILAQYLQQETDLLDGHRDPTDVVPHWFYNRNKPEIFTKPRPKYTGPVDEFGAVLERIEAWDEDPCFDLSDPEIPENWTEDEIKALQYYETAVKEWASEKRRWELSEELTLLRKWIIFLSDFCDPTKGIYMTPEGMPITYDL